MKEFKTSGVKDSSFYFDDYVIIESDRQERILIRPSEFEFLASQLFDNWKLNKSKDIQLLKEWNECTGYVAVEGTSSTLLGSNDTINAIRLIVGDDDKGNMATLLSKDIKLLLDFLTRNKENILKIQQE